MTPPTHTTVPAYSATIHVGLRNRLTGYDHKPWMAMRICRRICDEVGLCVTISSTTFIYSHGGEPGVTVGLINYPRFPCSPESLKRTALLVAEELLHRMEQCRLTVIMETEHIMLSDLDRIAKTEQGDK